MQVYAFSSSDAFWSSSVASATASFSCFSSASAVGLLLAWAGFLPASVARPFCAVFSSSSRRAISASTFLMFYWG